MTLVEVNWRPSRSQLRAFALLELVFFGTVAGIAALRFGAHTTALVLVAAAAIVSGLGLVAPDWIRPIYVAWMAAALPIGWLVSHLAMAAIYFLVITPFGLIMRAIGRDPMQRRFSRSARTYWTARSTASETRRYFRQY